MKTILIIDGNNMLHRAFHAAKGVSQAMVDRSLKMILSDAKALAVPDETVTVLDGDEPLIRNAIFPAYKEHRENTPEAQKVMMGVAARLFRGRLVVATGGFEADDVIARLVKEADPRDEIIVASTDQDLWQLGHRAQFITGAKLIDAEAITVKLVRPGLIVSYKAMVGDSSDNIPGAPGIGDVGAKALLKQFGSLQAMLDRPQAAEKPSHREILVKHKESILLSKKLATLDPLATFSELGTLLPSRQ